ncbi:MAG: phosphate signaling complex protein PhoU [Anaerolineae bacterium]|nr:phosphate signaling complex protein PhoU [Anaerolineae bacterium]
MPAEIRPQGQLDRDLTTLRDNVFRLGSLAAEAIRRAQQALVERQSALAQDVIGDDRQINAFRYAIEQDCYRLMATQQPTARDLRSIIAAIHITAELERMADYAVGTARLSLDLLKEPMVNLPLELGRMEHIAQEMLTDTLGAYLRWHADLAQQTILRDREVDQLRKKLNQKLNAHMQAQHDHITACMYLMWAGHNLERVADHTTNICERVVFMVTGLMVMEEEG